MPYPTGKDFAEKHNKKLHGKAARGAADVANKALAAGKSESSAIRMANAVGDRLMARRHRMYDHSSSRKRRGES